MKGLRILVLFLLLGSPLAQAAERLMLWEATSAQGTVYLFGSIHVCKASCFPLSSSIVKRLDASDALVLELDPASAEAQESLLKVAMLPAGETLQQKFGAKDWQLVARSLERVGLPAQAMSGFRPWMLSLALSVQAAQAAGFDAAQGIDLWALQRSREQGKPLLELENAERQIAAASAGSEREQLEALLLLARQVDSGRMAGQLDEVRIAWQRGDTQALEKLSYEDMPAGSALAYELIERRNAEMSTKLQTFLQASSRKLFVVVGAAHLVGPKGIPACLEKLGFKIRQLRDGE